MRVTVDQQKCNGAGICVQELPEIFRFHEGSKKGFARVPDVPAALESKLLRVARECPAGAIVVMDK